MVGGLGHSLAHTSRVTRRIAATSVPADDLPGVVAPAVHDAGVSFDPVATWDGLAHELGWPGCATVRIEPRPLQPAAWPDWVPQRVREQAGRTGIERPYLHQVRAAQAAWDGSDVALSTGTATGKSLAYLLPILSAIGDDANLPPTALYLAPTKALAHDQLRKLADYAAPGLRVAAYDGDTPSEERRWVRRHATVVVSNPDMVHAGILPGHAAWQSFFKRLAYVVVDEFHVYRGLFGANLAAILRRLLRVAEHYGGAPVVIGTSATVARPGRTLETLTGRAGVEVAGEAGARAPTHLALCPPQDTGLVQRTAELLAACIAREVRTLAFVRSRRAAEAVSFLAAERLGRLGLAGRVAAYRSGYLPEERRDLERGLRDGRYLGMAATSALELGIDISGLDAVLVAGWPGTRAAFRQRIGRAGRADRDCLAVFLADDDPLDAHLVRHPAQLTSGAEGLVIDAANPFVLGPHLCAAAAELPLTDDEAARVFGAGAGSLLPALGAKGLLRRRPHGWFWTRPDRAARLVDVRGIGGEPVAIVEDGTGRLVGQVDPSASDRTVHPGAVYTHQNETYLVGGFDPQQGVATVTGVRLPYTTTPQTTRDSRLLEVLREQSWGPVGLHYGVVEVSSQVTSFLKRRLRTGEILGAEALDLPVRTLRTKAVWWTVPDHVLAAAAIPAAEVAGAAHAAEHAAIGLLPLFAQCDRWDIGGVSTTAHRDTGMCTIVVHDGLPGGAGFAERGFAAAADWLRTTLATIDECPCGTGCPRCVQSPKCGNGNEPLDKPAAAALLRQVLAHCG